MNYLDRKKIESLIDIAKDAGNAINKIYQGSFEYQLKTDNSHLQNTYNEYAKKIYNHCCITLY